MITNKTVLSGTLAFVLFLMLPVVSAEPMAYCKNDVLHVISNMTLDINDNVIPITNTETFECRFGCSNSTLLNLGNPGCKESDLVFVLLAVAVMIVIAIAIRKS